MFYSFVSDWNIVAAAVWAAFFNSLPAVCILTGCAWLLLERVKGWPAATRYAGWCGLLAMAIALPVAQFVVPHRAMAPDESAAGSYLVNVAPGNAPAAVVSPLPTEVQENAVRQAASASLTAGGGILLVWVLAMMVQLVRLVLALRHNVVLRRSGLMPSKDVSARWRALLGRNDDVRRPVTLAISSRITMPAVVGYRRPVILLPGSLAVRLTGDQLDGILLHELAHVRRRDDWAIAIQRFLEAIFALRPLVHLITSKMELQREIACDDWVLRAQQARVYASCLTVVAECCLRPVHSGLMGLAMERPSQLGERVELLLDNTRSVATRISWKWLGSFVMALGLACLVSLQLPAVMAFPVQAAAPVEPKTVTEPMPVPVAAPVHVDVPMPVPVAAPVHVDVPMPVVAPVHVDVPMPVVAPAAPQQSKDLAREQAELSAMQRELSRKQAELMRREMEMAHKQMNQAHLQMQQQIREKLEPQMRQLQEQLSHMHLDGTVNGAVQAQMRAAELESTLASFQALSALSHDGLTGKQGRLSDEDLKKLHAEQARYKALAAELAAQQEKAAKEFSRKLSQIINDAMARGFAAPGK